MRLDTGIPQGATGIFAELAGTVSMSAATRELLHKPKLYDKLMLKEKQDARRDARSERGGSHRRAGGRRERGRRDVLLMRDDEDMWETGEDEED